MWRSSFKINSIKSSRNKTKPEKYGVCEKIVKFFLTSSLCYFECKATSNWIKYKIELLLPSKNKNKYDSLGFESKFEAK